MKKNTWIVAIAATAITGSTLAWNSAYAAGHGVAQTQQHRERHPEIRQAMKALERAKGDLHRANRDFAGHREKAEDYIEKALQELRDALKADKY